MRSFHLEILPVMIIIAKENHWEIPDYMNPKQNNIIPSGRI